MHSWWIKGVLSREERKQLNCPYFCQVYASNPGEDEEGVIKEEFDAVQYEKPWRDLSIATDLWDLTGSDKGEKLWKMVREEIKIETNKIYDIDPGEDPENMLYEQYVIDQEKIQKMLSLLEGLEEAVFELTDDKFRVKPEKLEHVMHRVPRLVHSSTQEDGTVVHTLVNSLGQAEMPVWFLKHALRLGRDIYWDDD